MGCNACGEPITRSDTFCPSCGTPTSEQAAAPAVRVCSVVDCHVDANIVIHGVCRCWGHYHENMDKARMDWREKALHAEAKRIGLTPGRKGETLKAYMQRHGVSPAVELFRRMPGAA